MVDIILFGGTSESRILADVLKRKKCSTIMCVATEYGETLTEPTESFQVKCGRLNEAEIEELISNEKPKAVIDATHPYSVVVSEQAEKASRAVRCPYIRVIRESISLEGVDYFDSLEELIAFLNTTDGIIFSSFGSKEAMQLARVNNYQQRVIIRTLPSRESLEICLNAGFPAKNIICMQGPFSEELNRALFREVHADILITKESGKAGGYEEKVNAARKLGMRVAVIRRPKEKSGLTLDEVIEKIEAGII